MCYLSHHLVQLHRHSYCVVNSYAFTLWKLAYIIEYHNMAIKCFINSALAFTRATKTIIAVCELNYMHITFKLY